MWITRRNRYGRRHARRRTHTRRTRGQIQRLVRVWTAGAVLLLALAAAFLLFRGGERPGFEKGDLLVCVNGDGSVEFYWPKAAASSALYQVEFSCGERVTRISSQPSFSVSGISAGETLEIRVRAVTDGKSLFGKPREITSWKSFHAKLTLPEELAAPEVAGTLEDGGASLRWTGEGDVYEVFRDCEAFSTFLDSTGEREITLALGEEETSLRQFAVRAGWKKRGFILCGPASSPASAALALDGGGQDLPGGGALALTYQETAPRLCVLEWNGTQCHHFEVRRRSGEDWETVARLAPERRMHCDLGRLGSGSYNRFRVAAVDGDGTELQAEEVSLWAAVSPLYSTIWPIQSLTLYEDPGKGARLASVPGGTALCVLAEEGDWFRVRYGEEYGWVDSRFCMIDLPEYVGDHCTYDITNSYDSLFAVHGSPIREVTHQVLPGYEDVQLEDGTFLVPYLYPCAKKLLTAAQAAEADGLRLKIYEAFRPQRATRFSYDAAEKQLRDPALTESGGQVGMSLSKLMTDNGRFSLGSFLARTISSHNRGIALDLTLEKPDGGELEMQSVIHDLSWYSETYLNNLNAKLLEGYMKAVGMNGLSSEWWHFQDDDTRKAIGLNSSLEKGVGPEGWTQDDGGWRYRRADGSLARNTSLTIDGRVYTFDGAGYAAG
ncbi:M15 family metallopeptidase [Oscillibacter sp.]|uniref:M15 family metallopeptidase n=1 Tax=Oscillibacter sp. TaxID=1945593 RepID=UPI002D7FFAF6|nr:M15 family metallopeptidase [Oscillibacter sp.]